MFIFENRASVIIYRLLRRLGKERPFLLPANVCPVVATTFLKAGVPFEFVDISARTLCMDENEALRKLAQAGDRYGGILFVRSYGTDRDVAPFFRRVKELSEQFLLIDDKCLAVPEFNWSSSSPADVTLYSTGYAKYVELGWGGYAVVTDGTPYMKQAAPLYDESCLDHLQSDIKRCLTEQIPFIYTDSDWLDCRNPATSFTEYRALVQSKVGAVSAHKQRLNRIYRDNIPVEVQLPAEFQLWRFNLVVPARDELVRKIFAAGLFAGTNYPSLAHIFCAGSAMVAHQFHGTVVNLFNDDRISPEQAWRTVEIVSAHLAEHPIESTS